MSEKLDELLHALKIEEVADKYAAMGYSVRRQVHVGDFVADLVATKNGSTVVIEVKTGRTLALDHRSLAQMSAEIRKMPGHAFDLVVANPPKPKEVVIQGLDEKLLRYLTDHEPDELRRLPPHRIAEVMDVDIHHLTWMAGSIRARGDAALTVCLLSEPLSETNRDEYQDCPIFPMSFDVELDERMQIAKAHAVRVDTTDFGT